MTETLLSASKVFLFGRVVDDLVIKDPPATSVRVAADEKIPDLHSAPEIDGVDTAAGDHVLLTKQKPKSDNGIWAITGTTAADVWVKQPDPAVGSFVRALNGDENHGLWQRISANKPLSLRFRKSRGGQTFLGQNEQLAAQLHEAVFARIYGFSYEGSYFELARSTIFLVHGPGEAVTLPSQVVTTGGAGGNPLRTTTEANLSRAPRNSSLTGIAAANFEFVDDLRVWPYDKADYTIRMDVETGMFEDTLLAPFFDGDGYGASGAKVSGAKVSGAKIGGSRIAGAKVSGAKLWGGRGDATD